ncbi:TetR/AcrR family transcriptional regulator [Streptomyces sp. NPDC002623]
MTNAAAPLSRRERNKQDKLARIFEAGVELFDAHGVSAVTTQEIAERADIGTGTLFQYVATKTELLVMIYNRRFGQSVQDGWEAQAREHGLRPRLLALLEPVVECNRRHLENGRAYVHEIVYGTTNTRYRNEAQEIVEELQRHIEHVLVDTGAAEVQSAEPSGRVVFAVVFMAMSTAHTAQRDAHVLMTEIDRLLATHFADWRDDRLEAEEER